MPTQLASDNFNRANSANLGANWTINFSETALQIVSNKVQPPSAGVAGREQYSAISWPNDQYSEWQLISAASTSQFALTVRCASGAQTYYELVVPGATGASHTVTLRKLVATVLTNLKTATLTPAVSDVYRIAVIGTTIRCYRNGAIISALTTTDSSIASGRPGITLFDSAAIGNANGDNWSGGDATPVVSGNAGIAGATITYSGAASGSVTADSSGFYQITGLGPGNYTLVPSSGGNTFYPSQQLLALSDANATSVDFTLTTNARSIGTWQFQGLTVLPVSSDTPGQPNVFHEAGAVILSGTVFKMWFGSANGVCYAESNDGLNWTRYSGNPVLVPTGTPSAGWNAYPRIFKNGSTYYAYVVNPNFQSMSSWTSPDGVVWTQQVANAISPNQAWSGGATPVFIGQMNVAGQIANTWYGYYTAYDNGISQYAIGLATSSDLLNWTADAGNPAITTKFPSNFCFSKVGSLFYGWTQIVQPGLPPFASNGLPSDITRYVTSSPATFGSATSLNACTIYRVNAPVNAMGVSLTVGQVADPSIIEVNGTTYMYATVTPTGNGAPTNYQIAVFTAPMTIAQLVQTFEGIENVPQPAALGFANQVKSLASDNFTRANADPIGGNWSTVSASGGFTSCKIVTNNAQPSGVTTVRGGSYWNARAWNANHWSSATLSVVNTANGAQAGVLLRASTSGAATAYLIFASIPTVVIGKSIQMDKIVAGVYTSNVFTIPYAWAISDVLTGAIIGTTISVYINNNLVWTCEDLDIASGAPGIHLFGQVATADAALSAWSGGEFTTTIGGNVVVAGATVSDGTNTATSDANGNYILSPESGTVTVTPTKTGTAFFPLSRSVAVTGSMTGVNFTTNMGAPNSVTITMLDATTVVLSIPNQWTATQYVQNLRRAGGVWNVPPDPSVPATWYPLRDWQKLVTS